MYVFQFTARMDGNLGTYHVVAEDAKTALEIFSREVNLAPVSMVQLGYAFVQKRTA